MPASSDESRRAAEALLADNDLDRAWLADILAGAGFEGRLVGLEVETIGTGQVGDNVRCHLGWDGPDGTDSTDGTDRGASPDGPPASVVIKLPSSDETSRATGAATRSYIREVGFYRDLAPSVDIRIPAVHHVWEDRSSDRFVLVMEDITPAETGDQLAGCSMERAELAIDAAAALHGSTWGRVDELSALDWVDGPDPSRHAERNELFAALYPGFVDRYRDRLRPDDLAVGQWLAEHFDGWQAGRSRAQCAVHGDFRLDNVLFGLDPSAPPITTVDWQTVSLGPALSDVAYFLSGSLPADDLADREADLLERYRQGLARRGVELDGDEVTREYRLAAPAGYVMAIIASMIVGRTDRGDEMFMVMARGSADLVRRVDTAALVD